VTQLKALPSVYGTKQPVNGFKVQKEQSGRGWLEIGAIGAVGAISLAN